MKNHTILEYADVCFAYDREEVLHNVNIRVNAGSLVAVVGPNGGGKSTLLKLGLGMISPLRGNVTLFDGHPHDSRRRVGYVPQHVQFDPAFPATAMDVVLMGRAERSFVGPYRRRDRDAAIEGLAKVGLENMKSRGFAELSGGERQRVLIAQALVSDPELLLLDEPTANVDADVERQIYDLLKELNRSITVVAVSHNLNVITRHASHLVCVNRAASILPISELSEDKLGAIRQGDLKLLQHELSCHVFDSSNVMQEPHLADKNLSEPTQ